MKPMLPVALALLAGCATTAKFQANMDSYMGRPESTLVSGLGPPNGGVYQAPDGTRILTYSMGGSFQTGGNTTYQPVTTRTTGMVGNTPVYANSTTYQAVQQPVYNVQLSCTINFTVSGDTVRSWNARGNHCVSQ